MEWYFLEINNYFFKPRAGVRETEPARDKEELPREQLAAVQ